ncbi:Zn-dependent hydrolase [Rhodococcus ruber]|nr:Zn-dependent hydrolase [Rhodococcus ruber]
MRRPDPRRSRCGSRERGARRSPDRLFGRFGDDTVIYPGHGKDTTLGAERPHLGEWRERGW